MQRHLRLNPRPVKTNQRKMVKSNKPYRPKVLDLFSGAGGLSLGFEQAGFDLVAAVELDPIHAATHSYNFPQCTTICADATKLNGSEIVDRAESSIDVVVGGAPCQGFSLIGQRALDDPRNQLVKHFLRLVVETGASVFVLENVKGLTLGKHRAFLDEVVEEAAHYDYRVLLPWQVLNAKDFGVPQSRERLFLLGVKDGLSLPRYPDIRGHSINCGDALGDLPDAELFPELINSDKVRVRLAGNPSDYAATLRCESKRSWEYGYQRNWDTELLTASMRTSHTQISRRRFSETAPGSVEPISRFFKLSKSGVSNTLRAGTDSARGAFTSPRPIHYQHPRCITVREMARLHGFPDWFRFHRTKWHGARQIGNAVPPPLARNVGSEILKRTFNIRPRPPINVLELGLEGLLEMDMKKASSYFGIDVPISPRNKKSGARKRKQKDIEAKRMAG